MSLAAALHDALAQAWPPFVLVAGLLAIGAVADAEGAFGAAARAVSRPGASPAAVLAGLLGLTALTSALLNLDTATAFLTPVMLYAARGMGTDEAPFLYGAVLMSNAGSLVLPGSNLTNLLVLGHGEVSGGAFFERMALPALAAVLVTGAGLVLWGRRTADAAARDADAGASAVRAAGERFRPGPGIAAVALAAVLVVALREPALPVLAVGVAGGTLAIVRGEVDGRTLLRAVGPLSLLGLLVVAIALGALAREWDGPARLLTGAGSWGAAGIAAAASVLVNNLPAAALLSAHPPAHPYALLVGLDLGPNLAVTGSLSALIWWRSARRLGAAPSVARYSLIGAPLALAALAAAMGPLSLT